MNSDTSSLPWRLFWIPNYYCDPSQKAECQSSMRWFHTDLLILISESNKWLLSYYEEISVIFPFEPTERLNNCISEIKIINDHLIQWTNINIYGNFSIFILRLFVKVVIAFDISLRSRGGKQPDVKTRVEHRFSVGTNNITTRQSCANVKHLHLYSKLYLRERNGTSFSNLNESRN